MCRPFTPLLVYSLPCSLFSYPGRVGLVELVEHHHRGAAVVVHEPPKVSGGAGQRVGRHHEGSRPQEAVCESRVDVVAALALCGDEEGQGAVRRQDVHAAILLAVPGHQRDAALLHVQVRSHGVQSLKMERRGSAGEGGEIIRKIGMCVPKCALTF